MPDTYIIIPFRLEITSKFLNYFPLRELNSRGWDILTLLLVLLKPINKDSDSFVADTAIYLTDAVNISRCKPYPLLTGIERSIRIFSWKANNIIIKPFAHNFKTSYS